MKILFRLNFHTTLGQSLWLNYVIISDSTEKLKLEQWVELHYRNDQQWEGLVELKTSGAVRIEYRYQLRQAGNGVRLDEWNGPRKIEVHAQSPDAVVLLDSWCSAGTLDYALETKAFRHLYPISQVGKPRKKPAHANHLFQLKMAGLGENLVPCLLGSVDELGGWDWRKAIPLDACGPNAWQLEIYLPLDWNIHYKYGLYDLERQQMISIEQGENRWLDSRALGSQTWVRIADEAYRRDLTHAFRGAGVAIPIFSLRSEQGLGVGEFSDLKLLAKWASAVGMKVIQILPINDTTSSHTWTDSYPYSAISVFALHPIYLRIDEMTLALTAAQLKKVAALRTQLNALPAVDYEAVMAAKSEITQEIYQKNQASLLARIDFQTFYQENQDWVIDYAVFCTKRDQFYTADFSQWGDWAVYDRERIESLLDPNHSEYREIFYHIWLQFELARQLTSAVEDLHHHQLALKGDLPIGIDRFSVDAWSHAPLFKLHAQAGAPPDAFAIKGQNWGFPTYDWEAMREDHYAWWRSRFAQLSRYFDAYRIDHILGFFRIWQIPYEQVEGIMGTFDPAMPIHLDEIRQRGIPFDFNRYCRPYLTNEVIYQLFGNSSNEIKKQFMHDCGYGYWQMNEAFSTQRQIVDYFANLADDDWHRLVKQALLDCVSEVLFFELPGSNGSWFHPRCSLHATRSFQNLPEDAQWRVNELYIDYFYRRQEDFWQARAYEKLPAMREASPMLLCGEDLGMVPNCVANVLQQLGILSLEIQRMPKDSKIEFFHPANAPYMSVVSPSTHDMPTLRAWWKEDSRTTARFAWQMFGIDFAPSELSGEIATRIINQHLHSPAMWAIFPIQDLLAIDELIRHPDAESERINVPAIIPFYWRYRMHLTLEKLLECQDFNREIKSLVSHSGRC